MSADSSKDPCTPAVSTTNDDDGRLAGGGDNSTTTSNSSGGGGGSSSSSNDTSNPMTASFLSQFPPPMMMEMMGPGPPVLMMPPPSSSSTVSQPFGSGSGGGMPPILHTPPPLTIHGPGGGVAVGTIAIPGGVNPLEFIMNAIGGGAEFPSPFSFGSSVPMGPPATMTMTTSSMMPMGINGGDGAVTGNSNNTDPPKAKKPKLSDGIQPQHVTAASQPVPPSPVLTQRKPPPTDLVTWKDFVVRVPSCSPADGIRETSYFYKKQHSSTSLRLAGMMNRRTNRCQGEYGGTAISAQTLKRLFQEFETLEDSLPVDDPQSAIFIRFDEEHPQYMRAVMSASLAGTSSPFAGGLFAFDIFVDTSYPNTPPQVHMLNTSETHNGFGPNLYRNGKVCLSLLGTWSGPGWNPAESSIYQVLMSIHALILGVEHPYFLEPGHGGWEGTIKDGAFQQSPATSAATATGTTTDTATIRTTNIEKNASTTSKLSPPTSSSTPPNSSESMYEDCSTEEANVSSSNDTKVAAGDNCSTKASSGSAESEPNIREVGIPLHVVLYEDEIRVSTVKYAMIDALEQCSKRTSFWYPFKNVIEAHFYQNKARIVFEIEKWLCDETVGRDRQLAMAQYRTTQLMIDKVQSSLSGLKSRMDCLAMPTVESSDGDSSNNKKSEKTLGLKSTGDDDPLDSKDDTGVVSSSVSECIKTIERIRNELKKKLEKMEDYVKKKDYIMAGQIQQETNCLEKEIERLEKLQPTLAKIEKSMEKAASKRDYIRAGHLQSQLKELLKDDRGHQLPTITKYRPKRALYGSSPSSLVNGISTSAFGSGGPGASGGGIGGAGDGSSPRDDDGFYSSDGYLDSALDIGYSLGANSGSSLGPNMSNVFSMLGSTLGINHSESFPSGTSKAPLSGTTTTSSPSGANRKTVKKG